MHKFTKIRIIGFLIAVVAFTGCTIFPWGFGPDNESSGILPTKIFSVTSSSMQNIEFSNGDFLLQISKEALADGREISVEAFPDYFSSLPWQDEFSVLSRAYQISLSGPDTLLRLPAKIGFSSSLDNQNQNIFAASFSDLEGWRLLSPEPEKQNGKFIFTTSTFSRWSLVKRIKTSNQTPINAPAMIASPTIMFVTANQKFSSDLILNSSFSIASGTLLNQNDYQFNLQLYSRESFSIDLLEFDGKIRSIASKLFPGGRNRVDISLFHDSAVVKEITGNTASTSCSLSFKQKTPAMVPDFLVVKAQIIDKENHIFETNGSVIFSSEINPATDLSTPALESSIPQSGDLSVSIQAPISFVFNKSMDAQSFINAFSITPEIGFSSANISWNASFTRVTVAPASPLQEKTNYQINLSTNLADKSGNKIRQGIEIYFLTSEASPPVVAEFYPPSGKLLPTNGSLQFTFSEKIATETFEISLTPQAATRIDFQGKHVQVSPVSLWQGNTSYQVTLKKGLKDLFGNATTSDSVFSFLTSNETAPQITAFLPTNCYDTASITTPIKVQFAEAMNTSLTESALSFSPNSPGVTYEWSTDFTGLTILFNGPLAYSTNYEIFVSDQAESALGKKLSNKYYYSFRTIGRPEVIFAELVPPVSSINVSSDTRIIVPFNRQMNPTITQKAFSLTSEKGLLVNGSFSWSSNFLSLTPTTKLLPGESYRIIVDKSAVDYLGNTLGSNFASSFKVALNPPAVLQSHFPANEATNIGFSEPIVLIFSSPIAPDSLSFSITPTITGTPSLAWSNDNKQVSISYEYGFNSNTSYLLSISNETKDIFGQSITLPQAFSFNSETFNGPRLISINPASGTTNVSPNTDVLINFDTPMNTSLVEAALNFQPTVNSSKTYSWSNSDQTLKVVFANQLEFGTSYILQMGDSAKSIAGIQLAKTYQIPFATYPQVKINSVFPASESQDVSINEKLTITFSNPVDQTTAQNSFFLKADDIVVPGSFAWQNNDMEFTPTAALPYGAIVSFGFNPGLTDINGLPVAAKQIYSFTTISAIAPAIAQSLPTEGQTLVPYNFEPQVTFTGKMATSTVTFSFIPPIASYNTSWSADGKVLTIKGVIFSSDTLYKVQFSPDCSSAAGVKISGTNSISFRTAPTTGLKVIQTQPISGSENVKVASLLQVVFDQGIDTNTFSSALSITPSKSFSASFSNDDKVASISFADNLAFSTEYTIAIAAGVADKNGIVMNQPYQFSFKTEAAPGVTQIWPANFATSINLNEQIIINFNKPMQKTLVQDAFRLSRGLQNVPCAYSWENNDSRMICQPSELLPGQTYGIVVLSTAGDSNGNPLSPAFSSSFSTIPPPAFSLQFIDPPEGFVMAPTSQSLIASFSNPVATSTFVISYSPTPPSGYSLTWSGDSKQVTVSPNGPLSGNQAYQIKIGANTQDIFGTLLGNDSILNFSTAPLTAPEITGSSPAAGSFNVPLTQKILITFSNEMNRTSVENAFSIAPTISGTTSFSWTADSKSFEVSFSGDLADSTAYLAKILSSASDINNTALGFDYLLPFQTLNRPELEASLLVPANGAEAISVQTSISMTFTKQMDLASIQNAFSMKIGTTPVPGAYSISDKTVTFTPSAQLSFNSLYSLSISSLAKDSEGNFIKAPYSWAFSTTPEQGKVWQLDTAQTTDSGHFSSRIDHEVVEFNNQLFAIGGYDGTYLNDVWKSADGKTWTKILTETSTEGASQFAPRSGHACAVFNNKIWMTGGYAETDLGSVYFDDVWSSSDGSTWVKANASAEYYKRAYHNLVVFDNKLWIIAGETPDPQDNLVLLDDCWSSSNGVNWELKSKIVSFFPRKKAAAGVIGGKLWVWGGYGKNSQGQTTVLNDGWYTSNGDIWLLSSSQNSFTPRCGMGFAIYSNKMWLIGGSNSAESSGSTLFNDIWSSNDGIMWYQVLPNEAATANHFSSRAFFKATILSDRLIITGGERSDGFTNEIWSTQ